MGTVKRFCEICGTAFLIPECRIAQGKGRFCSKGCFDHFQSKPLPTFEEFFSMTEHKLDTNCWLWTGTKEDRGYGRFRSGGKLYWAHQYAWTLTHGGRAFPKGAYACHTCDTPACVNPEHIYVGSAKTNRQDAYARGRVPLEALKTNKKVDEVVVADIRSRCKPSKEYIPEMRQCAEEYGLSYTAVRDIVWGRTWK